MKQKDEELNKLLEEYKTTSESAEAKVREKEEKIQKIEQEAKKVIISSY